LLTRAQDWVTYSRRHLLVRSSTSKLTVITWAATLTRAINTPSTKPGSHSDQGYQHSFDQAEMWAKEFDDPARDAWQKPDEVLDALHLERTSRVADLAPALDISAC